MANINNTTATDCARLQATTSQRSNNICSDSMEDADENDVMMHGDDDNDNNSIPTTMGVRASRMEFSNRNYSSSHLRDRIENYASNDNISVAENISSFFIPLPIPAASRQAVSSTSSTDQKQSHQQQQQQQMNLDDNDCSDDISTLTEYSMEENEDDNLSQTTANTTWTCVTEVTGSTAAAAPAILRQQNFGALDPRNASRRRILANKRTRVQQSLEAGNPIGFRDNRMNRGSDKLKRRRKT
eukprot:CAMPEP_0116122076 /NCGR_PEP_ID=MMETSP0329-20121206/4025_1 /TAXON_ID=697910 /ORGANISM="Pseudo-nitzschia arenysensis, Strain B593" /LENGTH=241 /DNA_ID=CAMNT_0003615907 /DNA_START=124 /DNA_END=849 /DNA_ORIENTATION=+